MRTRRRYLRRRFRARYVVFAKCLSCSHEEEIATFQRAEQARTWAKQVRRHSKRRISVIREV
jgi:hypothetical protein